jgi:DNA-binding GntR family transcriptional regulator
MLGITGVNPPVNIKPLREQVYLYLKGRIALGDLHPGEYLDLKALGSDLGISKTPLRDALIQLDAEGFVSILPRRGILVNELTLNEIRHLYEMIGALEGVTVLGVHSRLTTRHLERMRSLNTGMREALDRDRFDTYYDLNLDFHNVVLDLSDNGRLVRSVEIFKARLYDFPRREHFVKEWEVRSTGEHAAFVDLLEKGDARGAADFMRDVHWSFQVQEEYVRRYYFARQQRGGTGGAER